MTLPLWVVSRLYYQRSLCKMMYDGIIGLIHDECDCDEMTCKHVYRYADFVFVAVETIKARFSQKPDYNLFQRSLFWKVLTTTRTLVAHAFLQPENSTLKAIICENMKSLLALVRINITLKDGFAHVKEARVTFSQSSWLNLYSKDGDTLGIDEVIKNLDTEQYVALKHEFDSMLQSESKQISMMGRMFGHCCYHLIAKRDGLWMQEAKEYETLLYAC
jgi:hypothetical protein